MARTVGMEPKAPPNQQSAQDKASAAEMQRQSIENQTATLAMQQQAQAEQKALLDKQEAETAAVTTAADRARRARTAGRLSLLNNEVGTGGTAAPTDLQRRLGA